MIEGGSSIPVVYAIDEPFINRPAWVDYPAIMAKRRFTPSLSVLAVIGVLLLGVRRKILSVLSS
jgi:hypothetical protein